jgi:hypothetical protein
MCIYIKYIFLCRPVGRLRGRGSSPGRVKNFHFSMLSRPALGSTNPLYNGYRGLFPGGKAAGA